MATYEHASLQRKKDANGDVHIIYPVTTVECVSGLDEELADLVSATSEQSFTDAQKLQARQNIGAASEIIVTTAGSGAEYTATVEGVTELYPGLSFTIIPHTASTTTTPKLNVNGLGAKYLRQPLSTNNSATAALNASNTILANKPTVVMYDGTYWKLMSMIRPDTNTLYGTAKIENGGTGASTAEAALANLGGVSKEYVDSLVGDIGTLLDSI